MKEHYIPTRLYLYTGVCISTITFVFDTHAHIEAIETPNRAQCNQIWTQSGSEWPKMGHIRDFSDQISVHFGSRVKM